MIINIEYFLTASEINSKPAQKSHRRKISNLNLQALRTDFNESNLIKKSMKEFENISAISMRSSKESLRSINMETARFQDDKRINFGTVLSL